MDTAEILKARLASMRDNNRQREAQLKARVDRVSNRKLAYFRKREAYALCSLAGAVLRYLPETAPHALVMLQADSVAPEGHVDSIVWLLEHRGLASDVRS